MFSPPKAVLPINSGSAAAPESRRLELRYEPSRMNVVIVESVAKAKAINKYLGSNYKVLASYGHVRDLPSKDGSVEPDKDFQMHWDVDGRSSQGDEGDRRRGQRRRQADPGHRPRPRGRGHLLAHPAHPGGQEGPQEGRAGRARDLQRRHQAIRSRCVQVRRARSMRRWWRPISPAGRSTISSASRSRRCCGASCRAPARPAGCSRWRCGWCATARPRSRPSRPRSTGPSRRMLATAKGEEFGARLTAIAGTQARQARHQGRGLRQRHQGRHREAAHFTVASRREEGGAAQPLRALHHLDAAAWRPRASSASRPSRP